MFTLTHADYFVVNTSDCIVTDAVNWVQEHNPCWKAWVDMHTSVRLIDIPLSNYDIILTYEPILPMSVISDNPRTLFMYLSTHHRYARFMVDRKRPSAGYDIFLNHFFTTGSNNIVKLPLSIDYPYIVDYETMQGMFNNVREHIWCDAHSTLKDIWKSQMKKIQKRTGLLVGNVGEWNVKKIGTKHVDKLEEILLGRRMSCYSYMKNLSKSKYFLSIWRPPKMLGQSSIEGAAMGCVSFCYDDQRYVKQNHPFCTIKRKYGKREMNRETERASEIIIDKIKEIEGSESRYREIIDYQNRMLNKFFGVEKIKQIETACKIKRNI